MTKQLNTEFLLADIEANIETKEQQINRFKADFPSLDVDWGVEKQPRLLLRQLANLQDNLHRLKVRRKFLLDIAR